MALPCEITAGQFTVRGLSLGGVETCMQIPQLDLMFDVGHCHRSLAATNRLFITHGHGDHAGGLLGMLSLRMLLRIETPLEVYAPQSIVGGLRAAVQAYESFLQAPYPCHFNGLQIGDEVPIGQRQVVRAFRSFHVIETLGYTVWEQVEKLKSQFKQLPGPDIAQRKKAGEPLFDTIERPLLSFPGDTTIKTLDEEAHLYESRVLLLEATYIDERRTIDQCKRHGHIHLDEILERANKFHNEHLVLTHFSQGYKPAEVHSILKKRCDDLFSPEIHAFAPKSGSWPG